MPISVTMPRLSDIEGVLKNAQQTAPPVAVNRLPNPNLRGQTSWSTELN